MERSQKNAWGCQVDSRAEMSRVGEALGRLLRPGDLVALHGDLGTGKTTLTQAAARGLGITGSVTSPTFALIQEYPGPIPLIHLDAYRLDGPAAAFDLGLDEVLARPGVFFVEWAEKIAALLPEERLEVTLETLEAEESTEVEDSPRKLNIFPVGARYEALAALWEAQTQGERAMKDRE
jgi:tRNA threonylcarbamoyladenosine biosynthesis protein TsaE